MKPMLPQQAAQSACASPVAAWQAMQTGGYTIEMRPRSPARKARRLRWSAAKGRCRRCSLPSTETLPQAPPGQSSASSAGLQDLSGRFPRGPRRLFVGAARRSRRQPSGMFRSSPPWPQSAWKGPDYRRGCRTRRAGSMIFVGTAAKKQLRRRGAPTTERPRPALLPSSSGLGRRPLTAKTGVRVP